MKLKLLILFIYSLSYVCLNAQQFQEILTGSIVTANKPSTGCSWADYNHDGFPDLYISNINSNNQLFKNNGDGTFQEITTGAIVNSLGFSNASIWADYDNDGNLDLFVSNNPSNAFPPELNFLYRNNGAPNYTFSTIDIAATQTDANYTWSSSWVDYDNDGDIDLHMPDNKHLRTDFFYENNGDGTFTNISPSFVTPDVESTGVASWIDYDHDGDQDLFMIKSGRTHPDGGEDNRIYHNSLTETGNLAFERVYTAEMTTHFDLDFQASWGDYDNDGDMDVYLGNFDNRNYLYRNEGDSLFTRITTGPHVTDNTSTLGSSWGDFDNDGDLDLFVLNTAGQAGRYYQNDGLGNFSVASSSQVGTIVTNISNGQACANADYNNDGYLDLYVANNFSGGNAQNFLYLNNGGANNFLVLTLKGTSSNAAAIGAKIWIKATVNGVPLWQLRHISGSPTGNHSQDDLRVHFGLGDAEVIDSLIIEWPLGLNEIDTDISVNQFLEYIEGQTTNISKIEKEISFLNISPTPSNSVVNISYKINTPNQKIQLRVFDISGKEIITLHKGIQKKGFYEHRLDVSHWPTGNYYMVLENGANRFTKTMVITR